MEKHVNKRIDLGWLTLGFIGVLLWIMGLRGVFHHNGAKDFNPDFVLVEMQNVTDDMICYESNGENWASFEGHNFPTKDFLNGSIQMPDGSFLFLSHDGQVLHKKTTQMHDESIAQRQKEEKRKHLFFVIGGIISCLIAFICTWFSVVIGNLWFYEYFKAGRSSWPVFYLHSFIKNLLFLVILSL